MKRQEARVALEIDAHHRALRRCHGCGSYARPGGEVDGRLLCEKCVARLRRESEDTEDLNTTFQV